MCSFMSYNKLNHYEIMEVDTSSNASSVFNKYSVISSNDGWSRFHYEVTYKNFGPTQ